METLRTAGEPNFFSSNHLTLHVWKLESGYPDALGSFIKMTDSLVGEFCVRFATVTKMCHLGKAGGLMCWGLARTILFRMPKKNSDEHAKCLF